MILHTIILCKINTILSASLRPEHLLLDVLGDFGVFVDLIDGNECEYILGGNYLLPQRVVESNPRPKQHGHVDYANGKHHSK